MKLGDDVPVVKQYVPPPIIDDMDSMRFSGHPVSGPPHNANKFDPLFEEKDKMDPGLLLSDVCQPKFEPLKLQSQMSQGSGGQDDTYYELNQNDISVSIEEAKKVQEASSSWMSVMSTTYVTFKIVTKSNLPAYRNDKGSHVVYRRYSDFEYLLKTLTDTPEYKVYTFPLLPEKRVIGNTDDQFIERRRGELEGFLRVLLQTDYKIKTDSNIQAFLTFEGQKYEEFKQNPSKYIEKMKAVYNLLPTMPTSQQLHDIKE